MKTITLAQAIKLLKQASFSIIDYNGRQEAAEITVSDSEYHNRFLEILWVGLNGNVYKQFDKADNQDVIVKDNGFMVLNDSHGAKVNLILVAPMDLVKISENFS